MAARVVVASFLMVGVLLLSACGDDGSYGLGPALDTESHEDKENDKWWGHYYGTEKSDDQKDSDWWGKYYGTGTAK